MDYSCVLCDRPFSSQGALEAHERDSPVHKRTFHCETCDHYFSSGKALKYHRRSCGNDQASPPAPDMTSLIIERYAQKLAVFNPATVAALERMLREQSTKCIPETREFFTFPALHQNVAEAVSSEIPSIWFQADTDDDDFDDDFCTHVMGVYICSNSTCKKPLWVSRMVPIEIRGYDGDGYSAIVYNERCMSCNRLGTFVLDEDSYVERVAYRIKKWAGVEMELPYYERRTGSPHKQEFCEGCKRGKCREMERYVCY